MMKVISFLSFLKENFMHDITFLQLSKLHIHIHTHNFSNKKSIISCA